MRREIYSTFSGIIWIYFLEIFGIFVSMLKVTVNVGADQNIEIEIFAKYKYTLNELLVTKFFFQYV